MLHFSLSLMNRLKNQVWNFYFFFGLVAIERSTFFRIFIFITACVKCCLPAVKSRSQCCYIFSGPSASWSITSILSVLRIEYHSSWCKGALMILHFSLSLMNRFSFLYFLFGCSRESTRIFMLHPSCLLSLTFPKYFYHNYF